MGPVLAISQHTGNRLAEVAYLLVIIAGVWMAAAQMRRLRGGRARSVVTGVLLALAGVLLIVATHWGHYG